MNWRSLIDENTLAWLLPDVYAHYRTPLRLALNLFLERLPAHRQETAAAEQAAMSSAATVPERLVRLARSSPVLHKLGQTLARDRNLPAELKKYLQRLESLSSSLPLGAVEKTLRQELGPLERLGVTLLPHPLKEASVAVVVPFLYSGRKAPLNGVFKVLKPGIEERLEEEFGLLQQVGSFLDERCEELQIPRLDYRESFDLVRDKLRNEVRLDREQQNLSWAHEFYRGDSRVLIPALFDFCTPRVTAMERVAGQKATECCQGFESEKRRAAELIIETLIVRPVFSTDAQTPFHGDPHAGNLFYTKNRRLAVLDWSLTGLLGEHERLAIMQIILGAMAFRAEKIAGVVSGLSKVQPVDLPALGSVVRKWIGRVRDGQHLPGFTWVKGLLDDSVRDAGVRLGADLMLFRRAIHMVEGVAGDIAGETWLVDRVFLREFVVSFSAEWPLRFLMPPGSRAPATRISNEDLAELMLSLPSTAVRFWMERSGTSPRV